MERKKDSKFKILKEMWNGDRFPSEKAKYNMICYALGVVHLILAVLFFLIKYPLLGIVSCFSAYIYIISCTVMLRKEKYYRVFLVSFFEISVFSLLSTFILGWNFGFMMYIIALCPVSFFINYSISGMKRTLTRPAIFSLISLIIFFFARISADRFLPRKPSSLPASAITSIYLFNCVITFFSIIFFSTLFALEIRCKEKELEARNVALTSISTIDPLTKLINRRAMNEYLDKALEKIKKTGELFTLAIGDIDNFKMVNDIHGHNVGDDILVMVSNTLKESLPEDAVICRWGGEEFLVLLRKPEAEAISDIESARYALTQVTTTVEKPDGAIELGVTMTFGVSQYMHGYTIEQTVSLADENLYKGKSNGKNRVVHSKTFI